MRKISEGGSLLFTVIGPVAGCENFDGDINGEGLAGWLGTEFLGKFFRHLHILEHNFESLSELETALFLQFEDKCSFCIFSDVPLLK